MEKEGVVTSILPVETLLTGIKIQSSDQEVCKSGDWEFYGWQSRIKAFIKVKSSNQGSIKTTNFLIVVASIYQQTVQKWLPFEKRSKVNNEMETLRLEILLRLAMLHNISVVFQGFGYTIRVFYVGVCYPFLHPLITVYALGVHKKVAKIN